MAANRYPATYNSPEPEAVISEVSGSGRHSELVLNWRQEEFRRLGFASYVADLAAASNIDLHMMEDLLDRGCPHDLALQILMGTAWNGEDPNWRWTNEKDMIDEYQHSSS